MKSRKPKDLATPRPGAAATPFFARFLEDQHDAEAKPAAECMTLKYPSDRDEIDNYSPLDLEAAPTNAGPSHFSLKYPSDRDEIDNYTPAYGEAAATNAGPSRMTLKYPSDRDEIDNYTAPYRNAAGAQ